MSRRTHIRLGLIAKSREAALNAVQTFKNFVDQYATANFPGWQVDNWMPAFDDAYEELKATIAPKQGEESE